MDESERAVIEAGFDLVDANRELQTRVAQLENALRGILDGAVAPDLDSAREVYEVDLGAIDEARALLDGEGAPADSDQ